MIATTAQMTGPGSILGISRVRLAELARQGKIPRGPKRGEWDVEAVKQALGENLSRRQASKARGETTARAAAPVPAAHQAPAAAHRGRSEPEGPARDTLAQAQLMHEQALAARAAMVAKQMEGSLIDADAVRQKLSELISNAKQRLLAIGNTLAPALAIETEEAKVKAAIDDEVYQALADLEQWDPAG
jgi:hypothetical protein